MGGDGGGGETAVVISPSGAGRQAKSPLKKTWLLFYQPANGYF